MKNSRLVSYIRESTIVVVLVVFAVAYLPGDPEPFRGKSATGEAPKDKYAVQRESMVETQLKPRGIDDEKVLSAMERVERQKFTPENLRGAAYNDCPVPIGYGQTISQPFIVAYMTQSLELEGDSRVLEIGTGSGYQAAVLAEIIDEVYSIEIIEELAIRAEKTLKELGYSVKVKNTDGYYGWPECAPFDAIMITAGANHISPYLIQQLNDNGKLILPLGNPFFLQILTLVEKRNGEHRALLLFGKSI